jgi:hypothetical protein
MSKARSWLVHATHRSSIFTAWKSLGINLTLILHQSVDQQRACMALNRAGYALHLVLNAVSCRAVISRPATSPAMQFHLLHLETISTNVFISQGFGQGPEKPQNVSRGTGSLVLHLRVVGTAWQGTIRTRWSQRPPLPQNLFQHLPFASEGFQNLRVYKKNLDAVGIEPTTFHMLKTR